MPPAPIVKGLPPIVKEALIELLKVSELMLQGESTFGDRPVWPAITMLAVPSVAGAATGLQFCAVLQLLSAPPPVQVDWAGAERNDKNRIIAAHRRRVRGRIGIPFG